MPKHTAKNILQSIKHINTAHCFFQLKYTQLFLFMEVNHPN